MKSILFKNLCILCMFFSCFYPKKSLAQQVIPAEIPTLFTVTPSGGFSYELAIRIPPGIRNLIPSLSISYNSQNLGSNGVLGQGWSLTGLSSITRTLPSIYHNQNIREIDFTANDIFAIDGQKMFLESGNTYLTWIKNFDKIQSFGTAGSGPEYFTVEKPDGTIFEYGGNSNSRMLAQSRSEVLIWALNKVTDKFGNSISLEYHNNQSTGEYTIAKIFYTENTNAGVSPPGEIIFNYVNKTDDNRTWHNASVIRDNKLLDNILITQHASMVNKYEFTYAFNITSHLTQIKEIRAGNIELPPIIINWGDASNPQPSVSQPASPTSNPNDGNLATIAVGDYNGDGTTDFVTTPKSGSSAQNYTLYLNDKNDDFDKQPIGTHVYNPSIDDQVALPDYMGAPANRLMMDWNGDGFDDLVMAVKAADANYKYYRIYAYLSDASSNTIFQNGSLVFEYYTDDPKKQVYIDNIKPQPGDFNGDGKKEILLLIPGALIGNYGAGFICDMVGENYYTNTTVQAGPNGYINPGNWAYAGSVPHQIYYYTAMDYDGDGKDDLLMTDDSQFDLDCEVYTFKYNFSGTENFTYSSITGNTDLLYLNAYPRFDTKLWPGDFNGDGKKDLLCWDPTSGGYGNWMVLYSAGGNGLSTNGFYAGANNFPTVMAPYFTGNEPNSPAATVYVADFNGDGKDDILRLSDPSPSPPNAVKTIDFDIFYSGGFDNFTHESGSIDNFTVRDEAHALGDFNGDGAVDILCHLQMSQNGSSYYPTLAYFHKNSIRNSVASIDHAGRKLEIESVPLPQTDYTRSNMLVLPLPDYPPLPWLGRFPYISRQFAISVVKSLKSNNELHNTYKYEGAFANLYGLGFMGFNKVYESNHIGDRITVNEYLSVISDFFTPTPFLVRASKYKLSTFATTPELLTTKNQFYFAADGGLSNKIKIIGLMNSGSSDLTTGITSMTSYSYDPGTGGVGYKYGLPYEATTTDGIVTTKKEIVYNTAASSFHLICKPLSEISTVTRIGKTPYVRQTDYQYNGDGSIATITTDPGTANEKVLTNGYDAFGNVITKQVVAAGVSNITNDEFTYSTDGRFMTGTKNSLNYETHATHNDWGVALTSTAITGLVTTSEYDVLNRLVKTTTPDNIKTNIVYDWAATYPDNPSGGIFVISKSTTGLSGVDMVFNDVLGKPLRKVTSAFDGSLLYEDTKYDSKGRVEWLTAPYFKNQNNPIVTSFTYDDLNRELERQNSGGAATIQTSYNLTTNGLEVAVLNQSTGRTKTTYMDKSGATIKIDDNGNLMEYDLNSNGSPDEQKMNNIPGLATTYTYDAFGRLITKNEPNVGQTEFEYNALDQLILRKEAGAIVAQYQYDVLGRLLEKTEVGQPNPYTYTYNDVPGTNLTGLLSQTTSPHGTDYTYNYNLYGRISSIAQSVNGQTFSTSYTYDAFGRQKTHTYPSGNTIQNNYNAYAYLESIDLVNSPTGLPLQKLWQIASKNNLGFTTQARYYPTPGAGTNPLYQLNTNYDQLGYPTRRWLQNMSGTASVMDFEYNYNVAQGQMMSRRDATRAYNEDFTYDSYDRLTNVNYAVPMPICPLTMRYSDEGNILSKSDVSTSGYDWKYNNYALIRVPEPQTSSPCDIPYAIPQATQTTAYFPFKKIQTIEEANNRAEFIYWPDEQRAMMKSFNTGILAQTHYYAMGYERTVDAMTSDVEELDYIEGDGHLIAVLKNKTGQPASVLYPMSDILNSITHIMDNIGLVNRGLLEERSFDAWGRPRDPGSWQYYSSSPAWILNRGYTSHEHLNNFNIINMGGRLYDPLVGRMFSPDPVVVDNTNSQSHNKYSYVNNNPLKYTDPTGNFWEVVIVGAVFAGGMNLVTHGGQVDNWGTAVGYFSIGFTAGFAGAGAGAGVGALVGTTGFFAGAAMGVAGGAAGGFIGGTANTIMAGGDNAFGIGIKSAIYGGLTAGLVNGLIAGTDAVLNNANFWTGRVNVDWECVSPYLPGGKAPGTPTQWDAAWNAYRNNNTLYAKDNAQLSSGIKRIFGMQVEKDVNISTMLPDGFKGLTPEGIYVDNVGNYAFGGTDRSGGIWLAKSGISPYIARMAGTSMDVMFHAVVGHELVHAYNILTLGASNWAKPGATDFSENAAYEYSYKVFLKAGMFSDAAASFQSMQNYPTAPSQYSNLPPFLANP